MPSCLGSGCGIQEHEPLCPQFWIIIAPIASSIGGEALNLKPGALLKNSGGDAYIAKWYVTPWPEQIARKVEVGRTIPERDKQANLGYQHIRAFEQGAKEVIRIHDDLIRHAQVDLCDDKRTQDVSIAKVHSLQRLGKAASKVRLANTLLKAKCDVVHC